MRELRWGYIGVYRVGVSDLGFRVCELRSENLRLTGLCCGPGFPLSVRMSFLGLGGSTASWCTDDPNIILV